MGKRLRHHEANKNTTENSRKGFHLKPSWKKRLFDIDMEYEETGKGFVRYIQEKDFI